jgi:hypothetical protein
MSNAEGFVLPKPGIPRTLGILNIIFGVLLILYSTCTLGYTLVGPAMGKVLETSVKEAQAKKEADRKASLKEFDDRVAASKTEDEKKAIEKEKADFKANSPPTPQVDMSAVTEAMSNPTLMTVQIAQAVSGLLFNVAMIIAGIGLLRLSSWGRTMALWVAGLKIVRLVIVTAVIILVVQPISMVQTEKMLTNLEANAKAQGAAPGAGANAQMAKMMAGMGSVFAVGLLVFGSIYPIVTLILLNSDGAKAACQAKKPRSQDEF